MVPPSRNREPACRGVFAEGLGGINLNSTQAVYYLPKRPEVDQDVEIRPHTEVDFESICHGLKSSPGKGCVDAVPGSTWNINVEVPWKRGDVDRILSRIDGHKQDGVRPETI